MQRYKGTHNIYNIKLHMFSCSNKISVVILVYIFNVTYKIVIEPRKPLLLRHVIAEKGVLFAVISIKFRSANSGSWFVVELGVGEVGRPHTSHLRWYP
jgi:hypothetical protein